MECDVIAHMLETSTHISATAAGCCRRFAADPRCQMGAPCALMLVSCTLRLVIKWFRCDVLFTGVFGHNIARCMSVSLSIFLYLRLILSDNFGFSVVISNC